MNLLAPSLTRRMFIQWGWGALGALSFGSLFPMAYRRQIKAKIPDLETLQKVKSQRNSWEDSNGMDAINSAYHKSGSLLRNNYEEVIDSNIELSWDIVFSNKRVFEQWRKEVQHRGHFNDRLMESMGVSFEVTESYISLAALTFQA